MYPDYSAFFSQPHGYYSYLALSQSDGALRMKNYYLEYESMICGYFVPTICEEAIEIIRKDFGCPFYVCRMPLHGVGPGIPYNAASVQYPATSDELDELRSSILARRPDISGDSLFVWESGGYVWIMNLSGKRFPLPDYYPAFLKGHMTYRKIAKYQMVES